MITTSIDNTELECIQRTFVNLSKHIPAQFDKYYPEARPKMVLEAKREMAEPLKNDLKQTIDNYKKEKKTAAEGMQKIEHGYLRKAWDAWHPDGSPLRQTAIMDYNNAIEIAKMRPKNIDSIILNAAVEGRNEFVFSLAKILFASELPFGYKEQVEGAFNEAKNYLGYTELEMKRDKFERLAVETEEHLALLEKDVNLFENEAIINVLATDKLQEGNKHLKIQNE